MGAKTRLATFLVAAIIFPSQARPESALEVSPQTLDQVDIFLRSIYPPDEPGAAVLVALGRSKVFRRVYGLANIEWNVPLEMNTVFPAGSITKQFTVVGILMLVQEGRLRLDDRIRDFFPEFPAEIGNATVEQLLSHTAGVRSIDRMGKPGRIWQDLPKAQVIEAIGYHPLESAPGEKWSYSDAGYYLSGEIIEIVSGIGYFEFIQSRVLDPIGLKNTTFGDSARITPRRASGYLKREGVLINAPFVNIMQLYSAGGLLTTTDDMFSWHLSLMGGQLVEKELLDRAFSNSRLADGRVLNYGLGWALNNLHGYDIVEHGGDISGFRSHVLHIRAPEIFVAVLTNSETTSADPGFVATKIALTVLGKAEDLVPISVPKEAIRKYAGVYRVDGETVICIDEDESGQLSYRRNSGAERQLIPTSEVEFLIRNTFSTLRFSATADGAVDGLTMQRRYLGKEWAAKIGMSKNVAIDECRQ